MYGHAIHSCGSSARVPGAGMCSVAVAMDQGLHNFKGLEVCSAWAREEFVVTGCEESLSESH